MDAATGALNRILRNIQDAPKQALFAHVLEHVPPLCDATEVPAVYKTMFEMYENKGELFKQFAQPVWIERS